MKLYHKILLGLILGIIAGLVLGDKAAYLKPIGDIFIRCLRVIVVPLILSTLITGVVSTGDVRNLGKLGFRTVAYFMGTTTVAVVIGLIVANFVQPGTGLSLGEIAAIQRPETVGPMEMIVSMFPINPMEALAKGRVLQIIVFALLFGAGLSMTGEAGEPVKKFFEGIAEVMFKVSDIVISFAPYGVFALIAWTTGKFGLDILMPMAKLIAATFLACAAHILFTYTGLIALIARVSPMDFLKKVMEPALVGLSTCSAAAAFPFSMRAQKQLGVPKKVFGFTMPMALTINMDGTALYQSVAAMFVANAFGIELTLTQQATIVLTAVLASIGTASIPGGGLIMLTMVLESVGLPLEGIAIVAGIDRILDMFRTTTNIFGDNSAGVVVASLGGELDREVAATSLDQLEEAEAHK
ncbi:dicarboxylate/amino acid:cation symporter [Maridesulfovibrio salexigens]|uniref:Sodium:dicarboxylate symporter n=1 Tax=Maridesulfovibrio salexigens (strain ATCC 14822 / DSM 2638 / NCIMB 8403 / VKM B-1763) TaxID=526222 RepID=C6BRL5_MARSD|nr:dicarboxylate/amino acid:cation symporter [Maridesulfovibrio salexigens]ACS79455.1 sodium:dicarboxylate symporter [Maridesulfovibrio salexigens DSM 2638]